MEMEIASSGPSLASCRGQKQNMRSAVCNYIIQPDNWYKLKTYIDDDITSGEDYLHKSEMHV